MAPVCATSPWRGATTSPSSSCQNPMICASFSFERHLARDRAYAIGYAGVVMLFLALDRACEAVDNPPLHEQEEDERGNHG